MADDPDSDDFDVVEQLSSSQKQQIKEANTLKYLKDNFITKDKEFYPASEQKGNQFAERTIEKCVSEINQRLCDQPPLVGLMKLWLDVSDLQFTREAITLVMCELEYFLVSVLEDLLMYNKKATRPEQLDSLQLISWRVFGDIDYETLIKDGDRRNINIKSMNMTVFSSLYNKTRGKLAEDVQSAILRDWINLRDDTDPYRKRDESGNYTYTTEKKFQTKYLSKRDEWMSSVDNDE